MAALAAAVVALVWANSRWSAGYESLWETRCATCRLREWVDDGLMAVFFLVVAVEIKRELVVGDLRSRRVAALPAMAALGGMVVPALLYLAFNAGHEGEPRVGDPHGHGHRLRRGVVSLLGRRVPRAAELFLLALAVVDDLGAIVVIAVVYTADGEPPGSVWPWLAVAVLVGVAEDKPRVTPGKLLGYALDSAVGWALHESGVPTRATLPGLGLRVLPIRPGREQGPVAVAARGGLDLWAASPGPSSVMANAGGPLPGGSLPSERVAGRGARTDDGNLLWVSWAPRCWGLVAPAAPLGPAALT